MTKTVTVVRVGVNGHAGVLTLPTEDGQDVGPALRAALQCRTFDVVRLAPGLDMWIDDEGLFAEDPAVNRVATRIARSHGLCWQPYVGTVVFASNDGQGETQSLSDDQVAALVTTADLGGLMIADASRAVSDGASVDA